VIHQRPKLRSAITTSLRSVVIVCDHAWVNGGQAKVAIDSALGLRELGLDVCFVAGCGPIDDRLASAGIECHVVGNHDILSDPNRLRAASSGIWNRQAARVLGQCLAARDLRSTVVHVHGWAKGLSPSIGPVVTRPDVAHVYTLHEYFLACPNGGFFDYQAGEICNRRALGIDCLRTNCDSRGRSHKAWRVARQAVLWRASGMPSGLREVIYLSPKQRSIMEPYLPADVQWHLLPNPAGRRPRERIHAERNDLFLFVGRLSPEKGAPIAAAAAKLAGVRIAFCGEGEAREAIVRANPDAEMLGWLSPDELAKQMQGARCLVFPSLWYETYGLAVAEALRVGLPVLASETSVAADLFPGGVAGAHVRTGDVPAWAEAMLGLGSDEVVRSYSERAFLAGGDLPSDEAHLTGLIATYHAAILRQQSACLTSEEPVS
jgi:glycosyltransferase involved in cell wall biosynthesis